MNRRYLKYLRHRIDYENRQQLLLDTLGKLGIQISPFYLMLEGLGESEPNFRNRFEDYSIAFLGPADMPEIAHLPERNIGLAELLRRLETGSVCLAARCEEKIAAFTWCNFEFCTFPGYRFRLKQNEAYLYDAHTVLAFRGKGIAPFIRYRSYQELARQDRTRLYSISERFNAPALRFKAKLGAKRVDRGLMIRLFNRYTFSSSVNHYRRRLRSPLPGKHESIQDT